MNVKRPVTATITIGDQPTEADLTQLKQEGYTGVVNLRNDGEPEQPLSTTEEGNKVRALGMDYLHYGVGSAPLTDQGVTAVCDFHRQALTGNREGARSLSQGGRSGRAFAAPAGPGQKWTNAEVFAKGKAMGLDVEGGTEDAGRPFSAGHDVLIDRVSLGGMRSTRRGRTLYSRVGFLLL